MDCCQNVDKNEKPTDHVIEIYTRDKYKAPRKPIRAYYRIASDDRVKLPKYKSEDFELSKEAHIANYDPTTVANYMNNLCVKGSLSESIISSFRSGIFSKLFPITITYLAIYYLFNVFVVDAFLCTKANSTTSSDFHLALAPKNSTCNVEIIKKWKSVESDSSKVLTFFIGFYVSFMVKNWLQQVHLVPRLDFICICLDTFLWTDPTKHRDDVRIKGEMTARELRKTIIRYYLLSWTMCLSRISTRLNRAFKDAHAFNKKKLLLEREYYELNCGTGSDIWIEKWTTPLLWINKMTNDSDVQVTDSKFAKIKNLKEGIWVSLAHFRRDLDQLNRFNDYKVPPAIIQILTIAIYFFFVISIVSAQDIQDDKNQRNRLSPFVSFILDIPAFEMIKYLMLFGWLKTSADLQAPFGDDA